VTAAPHPTWRLIPSRFPPIGAFETVSTPEDLAAAMELEGWTNDRPIAERAARLSRAEWVFGTPNASVVIAAFLHAATEGGRFNGPHLGAWYAAASLTTAVAEVALHLRREAVARGRTEARRTYRCYTARLAGDDFVGLRGQGMEHEASQIFGGQTRDAGRSGMFYDSHRHVGGTNSAAYRPRQIADIADADHYNLIVPFTGRIVARRVA
jgi:hypothetical protein